MKNAYGSYKNARDAAWRVLIDYHITALPVSTVAICKQVGIQVVKNCDAHELQTGEAAICLFCDDTWYIVYDDTMSHRRCRFSMAHELSHIFIGHPLIDGHHARTIDKARPEAERQADIFAARLLAPACVLWGLDLHTTEEIAKACDISMQAARIRADRMAVLYNRQRFLTSPLEQRVYQQFKTFISGAKSK